MSGRNANGARGGLRHGGSRANMTVEATAEISTAVMAPMAAEETPDMVATARRRWHQWWP